MPPAPEPAPFPVIDISDLSNPSSQLSIAQQITTACQQWGFLLLKGHPIPSHSIATIFSLGKQFFSLPESEKEHWPINKQNIGYIGSFKDRAKDDKMSMWFGGVPRVLVGDDDAALPPYWRGEYAKVVEDFKHQCHGLVVQLLVCFALAMDLPDRNFFAKAHAEDVGDGHALRMLMYPKRTEMPEGSGRMQPHTDSGSVTLLFQDSPGLEVESPTGEWIRAPCLDDHILVNLGDALCFWSGGRLKATKHRVTFEGVPYDRERQSAAYFGTAGPDTVLEPIDAGVQMGKYVANGFEIYPGITVGEYRRMIMESIYGAHKEEKKGDQVRPQAVVTAS